MNLRLRVVATMQRMLPNRNQVEAILAEEPERIISYAVPARGGFELAVTDERGVLVGNELEVAFEHEKVRLVEAGKRALKKVRLHGEHAALDPAEIQGGEALILLSGRPAILIQGGRFFPPPAGWEVLERLRAKIDHTLPSVGRIELSGHPELDWVGTGFLVAEDVILTNKHVAKYFCQWGEGGRWTFEPGMESRIDYREELGTPESAEFVLTEVLGVHEHFDMALLRVAHESRQGTALPSPLMLAAEPPGVMSAREVYVVGYPAWDPRRNDPEHMRRLFNNVYGVKYLQPGTAIEPAREGIFLHDCSTLGGNSGSPVVDLETNAVVGLHFWGRYLQHNKAIALWQLRDDPLLRSSGVRFA